MTDETDPGIKATLEKANAKADPIVDRGLDWVMDSPYSAPLVVFILVVVVLLAKWLL